MKEYVVTCMAVAVIIQAQRSYFNYDVASKESGSKATEGTLFEVSSISKTFTPTLVSDA